MIWAVGMILGFAQYPAPLESPAAEPVVTEEASASAIQEPGVPGADAQQEDAKKAKPSKQERKADAKDGGRMGGRDRKKGDSHSWWKQMSEEQRQQAKMRWKRYREMSPDSKAEMDRRLEMLRRETEQLLLEMPAEEREALSKLSVEERDRKIRKLLRKRMKEKAGSDEHRQGPPPRGFEGQPLEQRLEGSKEHLESMRLDRLQREVDRAVHDGWLGSRAAEFYRTLPPEEVEKELMRFHKWRLLDHFERGKRWKELGIDNAERKRITALPPKEFMEHMRQFRPKHGERGARRERGEGRGPRGHRGDGEGMRPDPAENQRPDRGEGRRRPPCGGGGEKPDGPLRQPKRG